jgi:hypothetical protein
MMGMTSEVAASELVVEWAPFRVAGGVTEEQLLAASEKLQREFLAKQPGFVHRELLRGADGQWADLVHWENEAAANAVFAAAGESPICQEYFRLMTIPEGADPAAGVLHLKRVQTY